MKDQAEGLRRLSSGEASYDTDDRENAMFGGSAAGPRQAGTRADDLSPAPARWEGGARCIAVTSGKGGVGKTNVAVNLSVYLAQNGMQVGLMDADLGLANVDIMLGITPEYDLGHVIRGEKRLEEIVTKGPHGLHILAGGAGVYDLANLSPWRMERFLRMVSGLDHVLDLLVIDTGAGLSQNVVNFVLSAQEVIVVCTPEPTSISDAYGIVKVLLTQEPEASIALLVNMVRDEREGRDVFARLNGVINRFLNRKVEYLGCISRDPIVSRSVLDQQPFLLSAPRARPSRQMGEIAERLVGRAGRSPGKGVSGLFRGMNRLFR